MDVGSGIVDAGGDDARIVELRPLLASDAHDVVYGDPNGVERTDDPSDQTVVRTAQNGTSSCSGYSASHWAMWRASSA